MKKFMFTVAGVFLFTTVCFAADRVELTPKPVDTKATTGQTLKPLGEIKPGACCISGKYKGVHKDTSCTAGQKPKKAEFVMDLHQDGKCGETFRARVTDDKETSDFTGTVHPGGPKGCCLIDGNSTSGKDKVHFKGTICKNGVKWDGKGEFESKNCKGVWEMHK